MTVRRIAGVVLAAGSSTRLGTPKQVLPYVWKLVRSGEHPVRALEVDGTVPLDVDTWDDYRRLVELAPR